MLPRYDDLPLAAPGLRKAWGVFGVDDQLGTLNLLTEQVRRDAAQLIRTGTVVNLSRPLAGPGALGRRAPVHEVFALNDFSWDDRLTLDLQGSTQWDGFLHVRHPAGFYNGHVADPRPGGPLGIDQWVEHGIVGRGVLLDVPRFFDLAGQAFDPAEPTAVPAEVLAAAAAQQGVDLRSGDILCVRLGWHARRDGSGDVAAPRQRCAGLSASEQSARFLWDARVAALACDNPTVEVQPGSRDDGFLHHRLLTMLGMPLGELFDFETLAALCVARGTWDFLFVSVPLNLPGAVGSPGNAVAVL